MSDLILALKREYFEAIRDGQKIEEFRLVNGYWKKRLEGRKYDNIILTLGYPKSGDESRRIVRKWKDVPFVVKMISHKLFGDEPVMVYAIDVS